MAGFSFEWKPIYGNVDWQLTQQKSLGKDVETFGSAINALADATRAQNTNAVLTQIAQAQDEAALKGTNALGIIDPLNRTMDNKGILDAYAARNDVLKEKRIGEENKVMQEHLITSALNGGTLEDITKAGQPFLNADTAKGLYDFVNTKKKRDEDAALAREEQTRLNSSTASQININENAAKLSNLQKTQELIASLTPKPVQQIVTGPDGVMRTVTVTQDAPGTDYILQELTGNGVTPKKINMTPEQEGNMDSAMIAMKRRGMPTKNAIFLLGEMGREGSFLNANISGSHLDANAGRMNAGIISYSDPKRKKAFEAYMTQKGFLKNGKFAHSDEAVMAQVNYVLDDMQKNYPEVYKRAMSGDMSDEEANKYFGDTFIGWDRANKGGKTSKGAQNRADFIGAATNKYVANPFNGGAVETNTKGQVNTAPGKNQVSSLKGMSQETAYNLQQSMKAWREAQDAAYILNANSGETPADKKRYEEMKEKYGANGLTTLGEGTNIHQSLIGSKLWPKLSSGMRADAYEYMMQQNKKHRGSFGMFGMNMPSTMVDQKLGEFLQAKEKERKLNQEKAELQQFYTLASKELPNIRKQFPDTTIEDVMRMTDGAMYKRWQSYTKKSKSTYRPS